MGIKIVISIGNPGKEYEHSYHNAGHIALSVLKEKLGDRVPFFLSTEFMNHSGSFVARLLKKKNIKPQEMLILHDDSDLLLGDTRLDFDRGTAGHNGIADIVSALKTKEFYRLRIGIRKDTQKDGTREKASEFVLKTMSPQDEKQLKESVIAHADKIEELISRSN